MAVQLINDIAEYADDVTRGVEAALPGAVMQGGIDTTVNVAPKVYGKITGKTIEKVAGEVAHQSAWKASTTALKLAPTEIRAAMSVGVKATSVAVGKTALHALPIVGLAISIPMSINSFKTEMEHLGDFKSSQGEGSGFFSLLMDSETRGPMLKTAFKSTCMIGTDLLNIFGAATGLGLVVTSAIAIAVNGACIYDDVANPSAGTMLAQIKEQLHKPDGQVALSQVGDAMIKVAEERNPAVAKKLRELRSLKDPAYAHLCAEVAQTMEQNGNPSFTVAQLLKKQPDGSCELAHALARCDAVVLHKAPADLNIINDTLEAQIAKVNPSKSGAYKAAEENGLSLEQNKQIQAILEAHPNFDKLSPQERAKIMAEALGPQGAFASAEANGGFKVPGIPMMGPGAIRTI